MYKMDISFQINQSESSTELLFTIEHNFRFQLGEFLRRFVIDREGKKRKEGKKGTKIGIRIRSGERRVLIWTFVLRIASKLDKR